MDLHFALGPGGAMNTLRRRVICFVALGLCPCIADALDGNQTAAPSSRQLQQRFEAMSENSSEGHPDLHGQFEGLLRYEKGDYAGAMKYFLSGARYADKVSQLSIGLLYLNGQGIAKDPTTAYAWIALSAERNYPQFVATRNNVWAQLNSQQREKAGGILKQLMAEYGDAVAKPRMIAQLQQAKLHMTGSHTGFEPFLATGTLAQLDRASGKELGPGVDALPRCGLGAVEGGVITGCGDFWASDRWNSSQYFKATDRFWRATVKVGSLQSVSISPAPATSTASTPSP
jgi:uncharacterized protein